MRVIPVLDLMGGRVVRGRAGRRQDYLPIVSRLTRSSQPVDVARAFRERFQFRDLYIADLDAIAGTGPALAIYEAIQREGFRVWVDAGVREPADALVLAAAGIDTIVVGLETVSGPQAVASICQTLGAERTLFSLDLKGGTPLGNLAPWRAGSRERPEAERPEALAERPEPPARAIAAQAIAAGVRRLLVLDLVRVGGGAGTGTEDLCRELSQTYPYLEVAAGGGIRNREDLVRLDRCGVQAVLVASALHDDQLRSADWVDL